MAEKREVTRAEYFRELGLLSAKARRRRALRSEYYHYMSLIRWRPEERPRWLAAMRHIRTTELPILDEEIARERRELALKIVPPPPPPPPKLHRIKIRIYNEERKPTPSGMFQTFHIIDGLIDPETELVDWDWWLTKEEINIAKYHMVGYFKGMAKWRSPEQMTLAYFDEPTGVPYETERPKYKYSKNVPRDFIAKAEALTVGELIVGISSVEPEPNPAPTPENMGVFFEDAMIIDADGVIKWHERRERFIYHPTKEMVERVKRELGLKS